LSIKVELLIAAMLSVIKTAPPKPSVWLLVKCAFEKSAVLSEIITAPPLPPLRFSLFVKDISVTVAFVFDTNYPPPSESSDILLCNVTLYNC